MKNEPKDCIEKLIEVIGVAVEEFNLEVIKGISYKKDSTVLELYIQPPEMFQTIITIGFEFLETGSFTFLVICQPEFLNIEDYSPEKIVAFDDNIEISQLIQEIKVRCEEYARKKMD